MRCLALAVCLFAAGSVAFSSTRKDGEEENGRRYGGGVNLYSLSREAELGRDMARDVEREAHIVEDPVVAEYVNRVAQNLAKHAHSRFLFTVKVVRSTEINAYALPGGYVFVTTGLIMAIDNEAELASALAHEIAHVAARHYTNQASWREIVGLASLPAAMVGGWPGFALARGLEVGVPLAFRKYSRTAESQADQLGMEYLYRTGYDPTAFVDFFERVAIGQQSHSGLFQQLLAQHPGIQSRIRAVQKQMQNELAPRTQYLVQTSEFGLVRERLSKIERHIPVAWKYVPERYDEPPILRRRD
jgi:predicted Zn-dependent protease